VQQTVKVTGYRPTGLGAIRVEYLQIDSMCNQIKYAIDASADLSIILHGMNSNAIGVYLV
jgi:hypothetical protein